MTNEEKLNVVNHCSVVLMRVNDLTDGEMNAYILGIERALVEIEFRLAITENYKSAYVQALKEMQITLGAMVARLKRGESENATTQLY